MKTVGPDPSGRWIPVADVKLSGPFWAISDTPEVPFQGVMDLPSSSGGKKKTLLVSSLPSPLYMVLFVLQRVKRRLKHPLLISHPSAVI